MNPIPCHACGFNFMRHTREEIYCNNCRDKNIPKKENPKMDTDPKILITIPTEVQIDIEEICINEGISFSGYFLNLYRESKTPRKIQEEAEIKNLYPKKFKGDKK